MDQCSTDAEFDSYWDYEAKNKNRNRIRVGRQFQATIPPLLKPGEKDGRKSAELETLKWKPDQITEKEIEDYLSMAKSIGLFSKSLGSNPPEKSDNSLQSAIKGLSEFVTSHHPYHHDDGCKVAKPSSSDETSVKSANDWSPSEVQLFAQALESCGKNFCAIKKDFLPWKPVRSLIEYYYQGKTDKSEDQVDIPATCSPKKEDEPTPSCSNDEKLCLKDESPVTKSPKREEPAASPAVNFLENSRVTDPCEATSEPSMTVNTNSAAMASSTVGSLKFFLGGRLVLKLNAQQDSGSGTKCQWVQSNDIPRNSSVRKERHRRKCMPDGAVAVSSPESKPRKAEIPEVSHATKKPKLRPSEYDFPADDAQLLCSSSWTPPIADGREAIEVDDCSSKTSEGYISPVLSRDLVDTKWDHEGSWMKVERSGSSQDCLEVLPRTPYKGSPNGSPFKPEVLNHKSALRSPVRGHRSSPLLRPWSKWNSAAAYPSSPCSLSPVSVTDSKSPLKENPLDLSSKSDHTTSSNHLDKTNSQAMNPSDRELDSPLSSNPSRCTESPNKDSPKCCGNTDSLPCEGCPKGCGCSSEGEPDETALYSNLPYHCALNKCTKDYSLEEVPLDLSSASESINERTETSESINENILKDGPSQNADAVERGMLYQLLKNSNK